MNKVVWISWERHRRSEQLIKYFSIKSYIFESKRSRIFRHPIFVVNTILVLLKEHPDILIVQNPSIILALLACFLKKFNIFSYNLIIDSHNEGVLPFNKIFKYFNFLYIAIQKTADFSIVSNKNLKKIIETNGGYAFVLPDKIPEAGNLSKVNLSGTFNFVFICTYAKDEPVEMVIDAARTLLNGEKIYITGNYKNASNTLINNLPNSVILTGYLDDNDYWGLLDAADCIIDLTMMNDCLVCGAYEGIAMETPLILSDTEMSRYTFTAGALFTKNDINSICETLKIAKDEHEKLVRDIKMMKQKYLRDWDEKAIYLKCLLQKSEGSMKLEQQLKLNQFD